MFCDNCGTEVSENDKFCPNCGKPIQVTTQQGADKVSGKGVSVGTIIGAILWCVIISFISLMLGEGFLILVNSSLVGLVVTVIIIQVLDVLKVSKSLVLRIPLSIVVWFVSMGLYANVMDWANEDSKSMIAFFLVFFAPIWIVSFVVIIAVAKSIANTNTDNQSDVIIEQNMEGK
jgi:hypothetical protein